MKAKEIYDRIIELCFEIDNHILNGAILEIEDFEGEPYEMVEELEEVMVILEDMQGQYTYIDDVISDIKDLYEELYDM